MKMHFHGKSCGVISPHRARALITALVQKARACARSLALLVCVDGLASYVTAFLLVFRDPMHTGRRGRPRLVTEPSLSRSPCPLGLYPSAEDVHPS
jgi:hypothetical protein